MRDLTVRLCVVGTLVAVLFLPRMAQAQSDTTGSMAGTVKDTTGAVLPGVTVEVSSPVLIEKVRSAITDGQGNYRILDLRPGTYSVTFTLPGFATVKRSGVEMTTGFTAGANAEMRVGSVQETVTVTGASPIVDTTNVRTQTVLSRETLDTIPTGKSISGFAALTLGATSSGTGGPADVGGNQGETANTISIHGIHGGEMRINVDGIKINSAGDAGGSRTMMINQVAVQEMTLQTSGVSAEAESGGVTVNAVPKEGGNSFSVYLNTAYTDHNLQSKNLTSELIARGMGTAAPVRRIYDYGAGLGGRIVRDKLWFYTSHRWWGSSETAPGNYFNKTPGGLFYTPDLSRPAYTQYRNEDHGGRLTWQPAAKHKINIGFNYQDNCYCYFSVDTAFAGVNSAPEATVSFSYTPVYQAVVTWTAPLANRILLEAATAYNYNTNNGVPAPEADRNAVSIVELTTSYMYGSLARFPPAARTDYGKSVSPHFDTRASMSYVTGSHAMKVGMTTLTASRTITDAPNFPYAYAFRNGVPAEVRELAVPFATETHVKLNLGVFAQDQWKIRRLTLNLGVRLDMIHAYIPAESRPASMFVPAAQFAPVDNVPNYKDIVPRLGAAYDLFGDGKTAVKASIGKYMNAAGTSIADGSINPVNAIVTGVNRTWNDANGNYVPDCNLLDPLSNGECGPISNRAFGTAVVNTRWDQAALQGWGVRGYSWEGAVSVQHELRPGVGLQAGYFRTMYSNFTATQNTLTTPADYNPYCVTAPVDARLGSASGQQLCGLYDVNPSKFGQSSSLVTLASNFGKQTETYGGFDIGMVARLGGHGQLSGGFNTGQTVTDNCFAINSPQAQRPGFCHVVLPFKGQSQVKLSGSYDLPFGLQASGVLQNLPGLPISAARVFTNAEIAPSLGRNLAACPATGTCTATASIPMLVPNTLFEDRLNQVDVRLTKNFRVGAHAKIQGKFDIYNLLNANPVVGENFTYGSAWLRPQRVLSARLFKFGAQVEF